MNAVNILPGVVLRLRQAADAFERVTQQEFDLRVHRTQIVVCPSLHRIEQRLVNTKEKWLALGHWSRAGSAEDRAGVHDRRGRSFRAEHDQQIAHHLRLSLLVEHDDSLF